MSSPLPHPLLTLAVTYPERPFVNELSARELLSEVTEAASALMSALSAPSLSSTPLSFELNESLKSLKSSQGSLLGARVGLQGAYDERWVCWALALNALGATLAPLKPEATTRELEVTRERLELSAVFEVETLEALLSELSEPPEPWLDHLLAREEARWGWERPLFVLSTSGTTGDPKPVTLTTRALTLSAFGSMVRLGHTPNDRWLACLPLHHVGGLSMLTRALLQQTSLTLCAPQPSALLAHLLTGEVSLCSLTPTLLSALLDELEPLAACSPEALEPMRARLRVLLIGGASTPAPLWARARALELPVRLTWGMSEAASQVCTQLEPAPPGGALPPLPFQRLSLNEEGCLELTSPTTERGVHLTSDLGALDERGWVSVLGRSDEVIISGGVNIHPREVEERLCEHPPVGEVAVVGEADERWGQRLVAHLTLKGALSPPSDEVLRAWCGERLSRYKCPKRFVWHSALPRDALGKLRKRELTSNAPSKPSSLSPLLPISPITQAERDS